MSLRINRAMPRPKDEKILLANSSIPLNVWSVEQSLKEGYTFINAMNNGTFNSNESLSKYLNCDIDICKELRETCAPSRLKFHYEDEDDLMLININDLPDDKIKLQSIKVLKQVKVVSKNPKNICYNQEEDVSASANVGEHLVISVAVYRPKLITKDQEFIVLSSQNLCNLRDVILCAKDNICLQDHSEDPGMLNSQKAKDVCQSGYFFIDNVFYNDMRNPNNIEYSKNIFDWIQHESLTNEVPFSLYKTARMELTKFSDLTLRLGYPYLYCHQGNCEHLLVFTDMRLLDKSDSQSLNNYPRLIFKAKKNQTICFTCRIFPAKWMTRNDMLSFTDPSFFCDRCFDYLHYDEEHKKITQFQAYPYNRD